MSNKLSKSPSEYRARRAHKKSRNGCMRCKQRKKKCNEAVPSCSRCMKNGLDCHYRENLSNSGSVDEHSSVPYALPDNLQGQQQNPVLYGLPWVSSPASNKTPSPFSDSCETGLFHTIVYPDEFLDSTELELFGHYLVHTSRIIPFDAEDLYALQVGIPNLAFRSRPLMSSLLALAATCKCHDILEQGTTTTRDKQKIWDLLVLADQHHRASLLQVQADLPNLSQYDYVLANAALMVLYATANHCLRIRLAEMQHVNELSLKNFMPAQSQWISLIRAAHLAFTGLLNDDSKTAKIRHESVEKLTFSLLNSNLQTVFNPQNISPQDGPSKRTKNLLFPIAAASSEPAFEALRVKVQRFWAAKGTAVSPAQPSGSGHYDLGLQACLKSLDILTGIATEVFSVKDSSFVTSYTGLFQSNPDSPMSGRISTVPLWLRSYLARVTSSTTTPRPLRRVVMAFLNRVPAEYLNLVQTILDSIGMQTGDDDQEQWENHNSSSPEFSAAHKLAMEVFAHWIVLVMLLDGVWWIGGIGAWELGRIVSFMRSHDWLDSKTDVGWHWWPESMYNVARELKNLVYDR